MPHDPAVLDAVVKAYDVRGLTATQLTPELVHDLGVAAASVIADGGPFLIGRDMRPSSPELVDAFARGLDRAGDRRRRPRPRLDRPRLVRLRASSTRRRRCSPPATTPPATTASSCAGPARSRSRSTPGSPTSATASSPASPRRCRTVTTGSRTERDLLDAFAAHVRWFVDVDVLRSGPGRGRCGQRHGRARVARRRRRAADRDHPALLRTRRHVPEPPGQPARARQPRRPPARPSATVATRSGWPSTATPTGCSPSTRPADRWRPR